MIKNMVNVVVPRLTAKTTHKRSKTIGTKRDTDVRLESNQHYNKTYGPSESHLMAWV